MSISPCWAYLFIFYSCMCLSLLKRYFMTTYLYLMTNSVHIVYYFVFLILLGGLIFTFSGWLRTRLSGDVFCTHTSYGDVFCTKGFFKASSVHIPSRVWLFSSRTTSSILFFFFFTASLSLCDVLWVHLPLVTYSVHVPSVGDLFCTHGNFWWFNLYTYLNHVDLNSISTTSCLVCTLGNFTAYFVYFLFLGELMGFFLWLTRACSSVDLFCIYTSWWCRILYIRKILLYDSVNIPRHFLCILPHVDDLVYTLVIFMAYFVYFLLLGELILRDILWLRARTFGDLFCTRTSSWWPILYIRNFLMALSLHIPPNVDLFSVSTNTSWPCL